MTALLNQHIKTRGYWQVRIFPELFDPRRVQEIAELRHLVRETSIDLGSAAFPAIGNDPVIGRDWIGQEADSGEFRQTWRMYQSGQLILYEGFYDDWWDQSLFGTEPGWKANNHLSVGDALVSYWQAFELAARLSTRIEGDDPFSVLVHAIGLRGRTLRFRFRNRNRLRGNYVATLVDYPVFQTIERPALVANPVAYAVSAARELFARFGWDVAPELLHTLLGESGVGL
jgi:hypothetical protein